MGQLLVVRIIDLLFLAINQVMHHFQNDPRSIGTRYGDWRGIPVNTQRQPHSNRSGIRCCCCGPNAHYNTGYNALSHGRKARMSVPACVAQQLVPDLSSGNSSGYSRCPPVNVLRSGISETLVFKCSNS